MSSWIKDGGHYEWVVVNNGTEYKSDQLLNGRLTDAVYRKISVGNVISRQLNLQMLLTGGAALDTSKPITLFYEKVDSNGDYILDDPLDPDSHTRWAMGTYFIDTLDKSPFSDEVSVTAFDALLKAEAAYMKEGTWDGTDTAYDIVDNIAGDIGVDIEGADTTPISGTAALIYDGGNSIVIDQAPNIGDNGTPMRSMLSMVGALYGGNWIINNNNELELVSLTGITPVVTVGDEVMSLDISPTETIKRVEVQADNSISYRSPTDAGGNPLPDDQWEAIGGAVLIAQMPIMGSQEVADALYTQYNNTVYVPHKASGVYLGQDSNNVYYGPDAALGTTLSIKTATPITVVLSNRTTTLDALASSDLSAEATITQSSNYPYLSPVERAIKDQADTNSASITAHDGQIEAVTQTTNDNTDKIAKLQLDTTGIGASFLNYKTGMEEYIRYDADHHWLELGEKDENFDSPFKARLDRTRLAFTGEDGNDAAWISNSQLYISEAVITTDQKFTLPSPSTDNWTQETVEDENGYYHFRIRWSGGN